MGEATHSFTALVLAADRSQADPVAQVADVPCKALAPVGGRPMVLRVLDALRAGTTIRRAVLCGPAWQVVKGQTELRTLLHTDRIEWYAPRSTPSTSAAAVMAALSEADPVLLTTADHALLSAEVVDYFCAQAGKSDDDLVVALACHEVVTAAYPHGRHTAIRLVGGPYCGCNLFALMSPRARTVVNFWRRVESERKRPWRLGAEIFGYLTLLRYLTVGLTLDDVLKKASQRLGLKIGAVVMPFPQAAVDVDKVEDWHLANRVTEALPVKNTLTH